MAFRPLQTILAAINPGAHGQCRVYRISFNIQCATTRFWSNILHGYKYRVDAMLAGTRYALVYDFIRTLVLFNITANLVGTSDLYRSTNVETNRLHGYRFYTASADEK